MEHYINDVYKQTRNFNDVSRVRVGLVAVTSLPKTDLDSTTSPLHQTLLPKCQKDKATFDLNL